MIWILAQSVKDKENYLLMETYTSLMREIRGSDRLFYVVETTFTF